MEDLRISKTLTLDQAISWQVMRRKLTIRGLLWFIMMPIFLTRSSREITVHIENQTAYIDANVIM